MISGTEKRLTSDGNFEFFTITFPLDERESNGWNRDGNQSHQVEWCGERKWMTKSIDKSESKVERKWNENVRENMSENREIWEWEKHDGKNLKVLTSIKYKA